MTPAPHVPTPLGYRPVPLEREIAERRRAFHVKLHARARALAQPKALASPAPVFAQLPPAPIVPVVDPLDAKFAAARRTFDAIIGLRVIDVQRAVAAHYGLTVANIVGPRRFGAFSRPRQIAMFLASELLPKKGSSDLGRQFSRDHSTVCVTVQKIGRLIASDAELAREVEELRAAIGRGG